MHPMRSMLLCCVADMLLKAGVPLGSYTIIQNFNIPLQIQPQVFTCLCLVSFSQILIYTYKWSSWKAALTGAAMGGLFGGIEAALILTLRPIYTAGNNAPTLVIGIASSILLAVGLVPPYFEIYKRRGRVVGINFVSSLKRRLGVFPWADMLMLPR